MTDIKLEDDPRAGWHPYNSSEQGLINKIEIQKSDLAKYQKTVVKLKEEIGELKENQKNENKIISVRNIAVAGAVTFTLMGSLAAYFHYANCAKWGAFFTTGTALGIVLTAAVCIAGGVNNWWPHT